MSEALHVKIGYGSFGGRTSGRTGGLAMPGRDQGEKFERAVRPELPVLYRVARRMGCAQDEAEDLVQSTLLKAFQGWERFDGRYLRSWLIRILRNERLMTFRSARSEEPLDDVEAELPPEPPFWEEVAWRDEAGRILESLSELPEPYRFAVHLCDVEELSYEEAAAAMDVPIGTVRSRLFRGRVMLREKLRVPAAAPEGGSQ